jgi:2-oxoisovalerate dehydrogenase E2 component (dihydrolipoyl transacylase)
MPIELEMPELAESVIEGEIVKWLVKEGEHVKQDQPLVEVMTDKVTVEVPSPYEGVLLKQLAPEGAVVPIGKPIAIFGKEGENLEGAASATVAHGSPATGAGHAPGGAVPAGAPPAGATTAAETPGPAHGGPAGVGLGAAVGAEKPPQGVNGQPPGAIASGAAAGGPGAAGKPLAAPAVRKLARELGVDLSRVHGSGEGGRIVRQDVERAAASGAATHAAAGPAAPASASVGGVAVAGARPVERLPLRGLRRVIADHMVASKRTAAHTLHVDEADCSELVALREQAKEKAAAAGIKLTYLPFFIKAVTGALKRHPFMNASLDDAAHEIVLKKYYNIGVATDTPEGLVVPVIHDADRKTIFQLAAEIAQLADKARQGRLSREDVSDGTFTITNVGSVGGLFTFPVINYPEVGILGTHAILERPVVRAGQVAVRHMMYLSISFDHRVVDGALAARFVKDVAESLAHPGVMLMEGG